MSDTSNPESSSSLPPDTPSQGAEVTPPAVPVQSGSETATFPPGPGPDEERPPPAPKGRGRPVGSLKPDDQLKWPRKKAKAPMSEEQRAKLSGVELAPPPPPLIPVAPRKATRPVDYENLGNMAAPRG